jgi:hypothetical protein
MYRKNIAVSRASDTGSSDVDMAYECSDTIVQEQWRFDNWQTFPPLPRGQIFLYCQP